MNIVRQKGQVTLIAVILGVLGLTLGLAVASRSLSDFKQASTVDFGTKALAAAEAGAEYGLNALATRTTPVISCETSPNLAAAGQPLVGLSNTLINVNNLVVQTCPDALQFAMGEVDKDDVFQVDFSGSTTPTTQVRIYWTDASGILVSGLSDTFAIGRSAFRNPSQLSGSNFTTATSISSSNTACDQEAKKNAAYNYTGTVTVVPTGAARLLRITPIGSSAKIYVCGETTVIPPQYYEVTSTATTKNGTTKRVRVRRDISGKLPAIFDNVLYSGGSITK